MSWGYKRVYGPFDTPDLESEDVHEHLLTNVSPWSLLRRLATYLEQINEHDLEPGCTRPRHDPRHDLREKIIVQEAPVPLQDILTA